MIGLVKSLGDDIVLGSDTSIVDVDESIMVVGIDGRAGRMDRTGSTKTDDSGKTSP